MVHRSTASTLRTSGTVSTPSTSSTPLALYHYRMMLPRLRLAVVSTFAALFAAVSLAPAQTPQAGRETSAASVASYPLSQEMPVDPEAVVGKLPNGLRYYVRQNPKPPHRAELRLVVKAGSVLEDEDQCGLA